MYLYLTCCSESESQWNIGFYTTTKLFLKPDILTPNCESNMQYFGEICQFCLFQFHIFKIWNCHVVKIFINRVHKKNGAIAEYSPHLLVFLQDCSNPNINPNPKSLNKTGIKTSEMRTTFRNCAKKIHRRIWEEVGEMG